GRYAPFIPYFWGIWGFSKNKSAAKSLLLHLSQPFAVEKMVVASGGYDLPAFENLTTLKVWAEEGPPKGTLYHYPNPHNHQILSVAAQPAPPKIAVQIYTQAIQTKMVVRFMNGEKLDDTLAWAEGEIEGYMRTCAGIGRCPCGRRPGASLWGRADGRPGIARRGGPAGG